MRKKIRAELKKKYKKFKKMQKNLKELEPVEFLAGSS